MTTYWHLGTNAKPKNYLHILVSFLMQLCGYVNFHCKFAANNHIGQTYRKGMLGNLYTNI